MCAQPAGSRPGSVLMQGGTVYSSVGSVAITGCSPKCAVGAGSRPLMRSRSLPGRLADLTAVLTTAHATHAVGAGQAMLPLIASRQLGLGRAVTALAIAALTVGAVAVGELITEAPRVHRDSHH